MGLIRMPEERFGEGPIIPSMQVNNWLRVKKNCFDINAQQIHVVKFSLTHFKKDLRFLFYDFRNH